MKRPNKILSAGLLLVALTFTLKMFFSHLPDLVRGIMLGTGIGLELLGIYAERRGMSKIRNFKVKIFRKLFGQEA